AAGGAAVGSIVPESGAPVFVCGWSFGANVALREAVDDERVGAAALVGMPLGDAALSLPPLPDRERLRSFGRPLLLLAGEADPFCQVPDLKALARNLPESVVEIIPNTDHFFWRREGEAAGMVGSFAERSLFG